MKNVLVISRGWDLGDVGGGREVWLNKMAKWGIIVVIKMFYILTAYQFQYLGCDIFLQDATIGRNGKDYMKPLNNFLQLYVNLQSTQNLKFSLFKIKFVQDSSAN